jgi:hemerythrin-like domain-containing protein
MSDDLVERLRIGIHTSADEQVLRDQAASRIEHLEDRCANLLVENGILNNRIEKLEAALARIAKHDMQAIAMDALRPGERIRQALDAE